jgi:hypothetical protein
MTWSYSRIQAFENCPYQFFLSYIKPEDEQPMFFSDYGNFMHKIIEMHLKKQLPKDSLVLYYLANFRTNIRGQAPNIKIFETYFEQGMRYLANINFPYSAPLGIEERVEFFIGEKPFVGFIDCVAEQDNSLVILDNKSRTLKLRSKKKTPTKTDKELDSYLRQLYIYSIPIKDQFHKYPDRLEFNCFRSGQLISEPFKESALEETKKWALNTIEKITYNENWRPKMEYWKCRYLCGFNHCCEYYQCNRR